MNIRENGYGNPEATGEKRKISKDSLFIWIDILGFANALDDERRYEELHNLLLDFKKLFVDVDEFQARVFSDGIVIDVTSINAKEIKEAFKYIKDKQWEFMEKNRFKYFIRGGISIGSKLEKTEKQYLISNGFSKAVKLEGSHVCWPIIGTNKEGIEKIKKILCIETLDFKDFFLEKTYNPKGEEVYFIGFLKEAIEEYLDILYKNIYEYDGKPSIKLKYLWLLKYYYKKFPESKIGGEFEEVIL